MVQEREVRRKARDIGDYTKAGTPAHCVEKYVRGKNTVYRKWRAGKSFEQLDDWCTECLLVFGTLPHWTAHAIARRTHNWSAAAYMQRDQAAYRRRIYVWCLERGITTFVNQGAQFYRYFSAWYRYKWEQEHGEETRGYALQMY